MQSSRLCCSNRGLVYLLEPVLLAIVVITLFAFFSPDVGASAPGQVRLMALHAQDVLAVMQKGGSFEMLARGDLEGVRRDLRLLAELNPNYSYRLWKEDVVGGTWEGTVVAERGRPDGTIVSVSRSYADGETFFRMRLELWLD